MIFKNKSTYFDSIYNCPLLNWQEMKDTGDLRSIHTGGKFNFHKASAAWNAIMTEFVDEFGIDEVYKQYLRMMASAVYDLAMSYKTGDRFARQIAGIDIAVAESYVDGPAPKLSSAIAHISKAMGFRVDPKTTTVAEFFGYIKSLKNG